MKFHKIEKKKEESKQKLIESAHSYPLCQRLTFFHSLFAFFFFFFFPCWDRLAILIFFLYAKSMSIFISVPLSISLCAAQGV